MWLGKCKIDVALEHVNWVLALDCLHELALSASILVRGHPQWLLGWRPRGLIVLRGIRWLEPVDVYLRVAIFNLVSLIW